MLIPAKAWILSGAHLAGSERLYGGTLRLWFSPKSSEIHALSSLLASVLAGLARAADFVSDCRWTGM